MGVSRTTLLTSLADAQAGRFETALERIADAQGHIAAIVIATIKTAAFDFDGAVGTLRAAFAQEPDRLELLTRLRDLTAMLGWEHECREAEAMLEARGVWSVSLERLKLRRAAALGDDAGVIQRAGRLLERFPESPDVRIELANAQAFLGLRDELARTLSTLGGANRLPERLERIRLHVDADQIELADALAAETARVFPDAAHAHVWRSAFASWRGDGATAEAHARAALGLDAASAAAWTALGAAQVLRGDSVDARTSFEHACVFDPHSFEARVWLAELTAEDTERNRLLDRAVSLGGRSFQSMAWVLRELFASSRLSPLSESGRFIAAMTPLPAPDSIENRKRLFVELQRLALGNRSLQPTVFRDGRLTRLDSRRIDGPRHASRIALDALRFSAPEVVRERLDAVIAQFPESSLPLCHRGELELWLGHVDAAEADFRRSLAVNLRTRFAWVGLTGVELLRGRPDRALERSAEGVRLMGGEGPAVFAYRGEALRRAGRADEAVLELQRARAVSPNRFSVTLELALALAAAGRAPEAASLVAQVEAEAPVLLSDAGPPSMPWVERFERALQSMYGNRSTSLLFYARHGRLRPVNARVGARDELQRLGSRLLIEVANTLRSR